MFRLFFPFFTRVWIIKIQKNNKKKSYIATASPDPGVWIHEIASSEFSKTSHGKTNILSEAHCSDKPFHSVTFHSLFQANSDIRLSDVIQMPFSVQKIQFRLSYTTHLRLIMDVCKCLYSRRRTKLRQPIGGFGF